MRRLKKPPEPTNYSPYFTVFSTAKKNALKRNIVFDLSQEEFIELVDEAKGRCMVSGLRFNFDYRGAGRRRPFAASLDRIKSSKGYSKENCRIISIIANLALNEWGDAPLLTFCKAVVKKHELAKESLIEPPATIAPAFSPVRKWGFFTKLRSLLVGTA